MRSKKIVVLSRRETDVVERTLSIIKPDAVKKHAIGDIIGRFEKSGLKVIGMKMIFMDKEDAGVFYGVHRGKDFYDGLVDFMSSGPVVVMVLEGENAIKRVREIMGPTDPAKAPKGTIRGDMGALLPMNVVHGSDSPESARIEISYFFKSFQLFS
jgi:nucleoside-diphosphate kinase